MNRLRYGVALAAATVTISSCGAGHESALYSNSDTAAAAPTAQSSVRQGYDPSPKESIGRVSESGGSLPNGGSPASGGDAVRLEPPQGRSVIYTASLSVRAHDVAEAAGKAKELVAAAGGHLGREESSSYGRQTSTLVFKVPPAAYQSTLDRLGSALGERKSISQDSEDVTEDVADVESRLKSARAALDSLRALLDRAKTVGDVLKVERELADRESELEALAARQKALASQTSMATITLTLHASTTTEPVPDDEPAGFGDGLAAGWRSLLEAGTVALAVTGALLPWLVVIVPVALLVVLPVRRSLRRRRARRAAAAASASPAPSATASPAASPVASASPAPYPARSETAEDTPAEEEEEGADRGK
ncbi:protein of unknown function [Sinosporangium album]|uniref:DUF4349 domain-containing protein n=1 Tax=Sinosporangium album TaxID=504805 RepID=A0A1G8BLQ4_9ACTN|nr:DUF4349 domain-containing protein [Sinosporangium album]SDH33994.1 protein of unknown function [Sinosporangium album]